MTFRRRIALLAGLSFITAVVICSLAGYVTVRRQMIAEIDRDLRARVEDPTSVGLLQEDIQGPARTTGRRGPRGQAPAARRPAVPTEVLSQALTPSGELRTPNEASAALPVEDRDRAIAAATKGTPPWIRDVDIDGQHYEMITAPLGEGYGLQVARPLTEVDATMRTLALQLIAVSVIGAVLAAGVGWWVARRSARPVEELTRAAERVADTLALDAVGEVEVSAHHDDEIGRLARSMTEMLAALRRSREQQHQLVLDAGHELRTPLTSLRTNVGLLDHPDLDPETRVAIVADVRAELEELSHLAVELVELAGDRQQDEPMIPLAVDDIIERVADRARKRTGQDVRVDAQGWTLSGRSGQIERAIQNLVDNATKWNPPSLPIEITSRPGEIRVRDHGPGVADAERELVFQRFYRSDSARTTPGSGLGLAIVRQIITGHGGTVHVERAANGGAVFVVSLPVVAAGISGTPR